MFARYVSIIFAAAVMIAGAALPAAADDAAANAIEAKTQVCGLCHGPDGHPVGPEVPVIWGQQQNYLVKEIHDYRAGDRYNALMAPVAHGIAQEDTRPIGAYFAAKPWPKATPSSAGPDPSITDKLEQCQACHQPGFLGGAQGPRLAGLNEKYLAKTMDDFANGVRANNLDMPGFMKALSESERHAMAKYLSGL
jgi:cytochrome c553